MIQADAMYTTSDLRKLGIGDIETLRARKAGVKPVTVSGKYWYYGRDLIAWMRNKDRSANDRDEAAVASAGTESGAGGPIFQRG
jgi:hypothetical protein